LYFILGGSTWQEIVIVFVHFRAAGGLCAHTNTTQSQLVALFYRDEIKRLLKPSTGGMYPIVIIEFQKGS
jgi:hypothetical protein